eukprot:TRINITY_DN72291_c0_g1_i1.p3 TRINITY_DN72291_c0_g1~~TRINITY_DN72291_c0_g1_i1.p3  ORF type:complete len:114 (+),score=1.73 TRINITY_DN72291_c0_g1_i1:3-344(+)
MLWLRVLLLFPPPPQEHLTQRDMLVAFAFPRVRMLWLRVLLLFPPPPQEHLTQRDMLVAFAFARVRMLWLRVLFLFDFVGSLSCGRCCESVPSAEERKKNRRTRGLRERRAVH